MLTSPRSDQMKLFVIPTNLIHQIKTEIDDLEWSWDEIEINKYACSEFSGTNYFSDPKITLNEYCANFTGKVYIIVANT